MENKIDLKKAIVLGLIVCLVISAVFLFINYKEYRKYTETFNLKLNKMVGRTKTSKSIFCGKKYKRGLSRC